MSKLIKYIQTEPLSSGLILLSVIVLAISLVQWWPVALDDTFISLRYSKHMAAGSGVTWNAGETPPVEGYSSFLWVLLMALPHLLGINALLFAKVIGTLATVACMVTGFLFARRLTGFYKGQWSLLPASTTLLYSASASVTAVHAVTGMETALFTLSLTLFFFATHGFLVRPSRRGATFLGLLAIASGLLRPEGNMVVFASLFAAYIITDQEHRKLLLGRILLLYVLPGAVYFAWRWHYYGLIFPLPFYVKLASQSFMAGRGAVLEFVLAASPFVGIFILVGFFRFNRFMVPSIVGALLLLAFFMFPRHTMGIQYRFFMPVIPLMLVFAASGMAVIINWFQDHAVWKNIGVRVAIFIVIILPAPVLLRSNLMIKSQYVVNLSKYSSRVGKILRRFKWRDRSPVLAIAYAGAIPYYSEWTVIDLLGLSNRHIALAGRCEPEYVLSRNPDLLILVSFEGEEFKARDPRFKTLYDDALKNGMKKCISIMYFDGFNVWFVARQNGRLWDFLKNNLSPSLFNDTK